MEAQIKPTPKALVENGIIHNGFFETPFRRANLLDAKNMGGKLARPLRWLRLKEWVGFGINHPRLFGGIIIQDAKYASSGTVYLYDKESRKQYEWLVVDLPGRIEIAETLWNAHCHAGFAGRWVKFEHNLDNLNHRLHAEFKASAGSPSLKVDLLLHQDWTATDPLVVSLPIAPDHHTYTHKSPLHAEGFIQIGDERFDFDPQRDLMNLDEQKTFYPYRSNWHWACFGGHTDEGRELMLNVVDQMTEKGQPGEDAIWLDGRLTLIEQPEFIPENGNGAYRLEDPAGRIRLHFTPEGSKAERRNYFLIDMDYEQFFGRYNGEITDEDGNTHRIKDMFGALERMKARF